MSNSIRCVCGGGGGTFLSIIVIPLSDVTTMGVNQSDVIL